MNDASIHPSNQLPGGVETGDTVMKMRRVFISPLCVFSVGMAAVSEVSEACVRCLLD